MIIRDCLTAIILTCCCPLMARGQAFFTPGVSSFTAEIGVVNSGIVNDLSATVSADRKYVTLGVRAQESKLLALQEFRVNGPQVTGFVGGVQLNGSAGGSGQFGSINPPMELIPGRGTTILRQRGMTRITVR